MNQMEKHENGLPRCSRKERRKEGRKEVGRVEGKMEKRKEHSKEGRKEKETILVTVQAQEAIDKASALAPGSLFRAPS